ncbi:polysaccharide biosynthesis tyrosine autokinase [Gordonia sp. IITR100]|uniref:polysaccharide biosynthesis tyrosine autokinase n=1 Tax=Gordonia sp. IITR100 TaxID=1314686 RepID=UPI000990FEEF|nr:polysaccharide biosynthesis tyrosine autokinase [Gordonia sp. IITR100]
MNQTEAVGTASTGDRLRVLLRVIRDGWWIIGLCVLIGGASAVGLSLTQTPMYRSSAVLYVTSGTEATVQNAYQGSLASQQRVASYVRLVDSEAVLSSALTDSGLQMSVEDARDAVSAYTSVETVILTVSATNADPVVASGLANRVAESLVGYVSVLETPSSGGDPLAKVTVVSPATTSDAPISPRTKRNLAVGLCVGLLLGLLIVLARHRLDTRLRSEADVSELLPNVSSLCTVPDDPALQDKVLLDFAPAGASPTGEAYRRLRVNLGFMSVDTPARRILVTSANPGEGKTTTAVNLAAAFAESGNRVVLVEADLRKPSASQRMRLTNSIGLTDYLRGSVENVSDVIQRSNTPGVDVLASGPVPPNPAELLASQRTGRCFAELEAQYDLVIVDSGPVMPVTDAVELTKWVHGVVVVVRAGSTKRTELLSTFTELERAQANILGVVVNGVSDRERTYRYGYYGNASDVDARHVNPATVEARASRDALPDSPTDGRSVYR